MQPKPDKATVGRLAERICRQWNVEATRERKADFYEALDDLAEAWITAGAAWILKSRKRQEGCPTPADWRDAAISARTVHLRGLDTKPTSPPADPAEAAAAMAAIRARMTVSAEPLLDTHDNRRAGYLFEECFHAAHGVRRDDLRLDRATATALQAVGGMDVLRHLEPGQVFEARRCFVAAYLEAEKP
jgi:hypothetical protein